MSALLSGCIVPLPHRRLHEFGVTGRVVDSRTQTPVALAKIEAFEHAKDVTFSDAQGTFVLKPVYGWHGAYALGPVGVSMFPGFDVPDFRRSVMVSARGYATKTFEFHRHPSEADSIHAGDVRLPRGAVRPN